MADSRRDPNGARVATTVCLLFFLLGFSGASVSGASGFPNYPADIDQRGVSPSRQQETRATVQTDAITRLSKVFGIDRVPMHRHHRSPPQYMVELYNTVAYHNGITRIPGPYGSDVVRGFPDRGRSRSL